MPPNTIQQLVRDNIPEIIAVNNRRSTTEILSDTEYIKHLDSKLDEEFADYHADHSVEELADLFEVIYAAAAGLRKRYY